MNTEQKNTEKKQAERKGSFFVPEGYMEGLPRRIMEQLPEKEAKEPIKVSLYDRVRPWLYLAGIFCGLGLFFKVIVSFDGEKGNRETALLVKTEMPADNVLPVSANADEGDSEYLEYVEALYTNLIFDAETEGSE